MKKFLSLVLALIMTMSLVTISAGAEDFTDDGKITYKEAVDVMSAVKVIDGYADGSFNPQGNLTRGAAAKIICNLILGPTTAAALSADTAPYKDVPVNHTFAGYIAYCQQQGIISGYADGTFRPSATLTNYAFLKMLLGALGYDAQVEGYVGDNWSIQVAKQALAIGLTDGLKNELNGTAAATREEACLYALNTMQSTMVDYDTKTTVSVGGAQVVVAGTTAQNVKWTGTKNADGNIKDDGLVQFAEKYFEKLTVKKVAGVYGRPSNNWKLKTEDIGTYSTIAPDLVYTEKVKDKELYKDVGKVVASSDYAWEQYIDGAYTGNVARPVSGSSSTYGATQNGVVTEVYVDDTEDAETVTVVYINQYLGEVTKVKTDDDGRYLTIDVKNGSVDDKKFYTDDFDEDDFVAVTLDIDDDGDTYIASVYELEVVSGKVTAVEEANKHDSFAAVTYIEMDDEKYTYNIKADFDVEANNNNDPELNTEYELYLDANGFILGFKALEDVSHNYLYVKAAGDYLKDWQAKVVLADGTAKTINVKDKLGDALETKLTNKNQIEEFVCAYSVNDKDVYTLEPISKVTGPNGIREYSESPTVANQATIENGSAWLGTQLTDKDTVYVDVKDEVIYTGYENVPDYTDADVIYVHHDNDGVVDIAFIIDYAQKSNDSTTYYYVVKTGDYKTFKENNTEYVKRTVYINGEKETLTIDADKDAAVMVNGVGLYKVKAVNDKGYVTDAAFVNLTAAEKEYISLGNGTFWNGQNQAIEESAPISTKYWKYNDDTVFVFVDQDDKKVTTGSVKDFEKKADVDPGEEYTKVAVVTADKNLAELVIIRTYVKPVPVYYTVDWNVPANVTITVTDDGTPMANGTKALAGSNVVLTATPAAGYEVSVDGGSTWSDAATTDSVASLAGNKTFAVAVREKDTRVDVTLNFIQDALVTIDGVEYDSNTTTVKLALGRYDVTVEYADGVAAAAQVLTAADGASIQKYSGTYKLTVTAAGTLTIGQKADALTVTKDGADLTSWTVAGPATVVEGVEFEITVTGPTGDYSGSFDATKWHVSGGTMGTPELTNTGADGSAAVVTIPVTVSSVTGPVTVEVTYG